MGTNKSNLALVAPQVSPNGSHLSDAPPAIESVNPLLSDEIAEANLLGAILNNDEIFPEVKACFDPRWFWSVKHQWIYLAMLRISERPGESLDLTTVAGELRIAGKLDQIGPDPNGAYLLQLSNDCLSWRTLRTHRNAVEEAWRRREFLNRLGALGTLALQKDGIEPARAGALELVDFIIKADSDDDYKLLTNAEIDALPPTAWLDSNHELVEGGFNMLFGKTGIGKTFLSLDYALTAAQTMGVVYIAGEGRSGFADRIAAWKSRHDLSSGYFRLIDQPINIRSEAEITKLISKCKRQPFPIKFLIVDTLARCFGDGEENDSSAMNQFVNGCGRIQRELSATVLIDHHEGKDGTKGPRGASSLPAACDSIIHMTRSADGLILLSPFKVKHGIEFAKRGLKIVAGTDGRGATLMDSKLVQQSKADRLTPSQTTILEFLDAARAGGQPTTWAIIRDQTELGATTVTDGLRELHRLDYVEKLPLTGAYQITDLGQLKLNGNAGTPEDAG